MAVAAREDHPPAHAARADPRTAPTHDVAVEDRERLRVHERPDHRRLRVHHHVLAASGPPTGMVREQRSGGRLGAGVAERLPERQPERRPVVVAADVHRPTHRGDHDVVGRERAARWTVAERRDARVDDGGAHSGELCDQPGGRGVRRERFDDDVDVVQEAGEDFRRRWMLERERHAELAGVGGVPEESVLATVGRTPARRELSPRVSAGGLDLDDLDPEVGEHPAAEPAERVGEIEGAKAAERRRHGAAAYHTAARGGNRRSVAWCPLGHYRQWTVRCAGNRGSCAGVRASGMRTRNSLPPPGGISTTTSPPRSRTQR